MKRTPLFRRRPRLLCYLLGHDYELERGVLRYRCKRCARTWPS